MDKRIVSFELLDYIKEAFIFRNASASRGNRRIPLAVTFVDISLSRVQRQSYLILDSSRIEYSVSRLEFRAPSFERLE